MKKIALLSVALFMINCSSTVPKIEEKEVVKDTVKLKTFNNKLGYSIGIEIGNSLKVLKGYYNLDALLEGIFTEVTGGKKRMSDNEMKNVQKKLQHLMKNKLAKSGKEESMAKMKKAESNKLKGEKFLLENGKKEGIITTKSGLQYEVLKNGDGKNKPTKDQSVTVHYVGKTLNGKVFDSSIKRGQPATFPLNRVIAGWTEGVQLMSVGAKYRFYIPSNLAYGRNGAGSDIGPNETLIFDIELLKIQ